MGGGLGVGKVGPSCACCVGYSRLHNPSKVTFSASLVPPPLDPSLGARDGYCGWPGHLGSTLFRAYRRHGRLCTVCGV